MSQTRTRHAYGPQATDVGAETAGREGSKRAEGASGQLERARAEDLGTEAGTSSSGGDAGVDLAYTTPEETCENLLEVT
jgi:hypothetical protein